MKSKKTINKISSSLAAKVLFLSDRTCCVCRNNGKPVQIHHLDSNSSNNDLKNLAVLCFDCHTDTQIKGGFHRKLDAEQIILYRDNWLIMVAKKRVNDHESLVNLESQMDTVDIEVATSIAEIYRDKGEYELLAIHYMAYKNDELRDKYIDLAIRKGVDDETLIFFRKKQGLLSKVPPETIQKEIILLEGKSYFSRLGRLHRDLGNYKESVIATCKSIIQSLEENNPFSAAFYLKEMVSEGDTEALFISAIEKAKAEKDLWWQYRALEEL